MTIEPILLDKAHHAEALERLTLKALSAGDAAAAFRYADRRCRVSPRAQAHHFLLRAEASHQIGHTDDAIADIGTALALEPDNRSANRRMMAWDSGPARVVSARRLIAQDDDFNVIKQAIAVLAASGEQNFAAVSSTETCVIGWAAWSEADSLELEISNCDRILTLPISSSADHPLAGSRKYAANFALPRPRSAFTQQATLRCGTKIILTAQLRPNAPAKIHRAQPDTAEAFVKSRKVTIIVPVYGDFDATRACLERLALELNNVGESAEAIVVDDASPDDRIRVYLRELMARPRFTVLQNERNLGFVDSVNRALTQAAPGDVLLLNADTLPPPGFIQRLAEAAHAEPGIGTVTPLSNNGEFTSFPVPFRENELPTPDKIRELDLIAKSVNYQRVIDIPNGIGFCLYITQPCRQAVGPLAETVHRGYLEDVDFCLRARAHGFRNVCATSVYLGHAGSRSFGEEKRALVVRNLTALELRYPRYRNECAAFMLADPLKPYRAAIESHLPATGADVFVSGTGLLQSVAKQRASELQGITLAAQFAARGPIVTVCAPNRNIPQSLAFDLATRTGVVELRSYLTAIKPTRFELVDPVCTPEVVREMIVARNLARFDILIADAGLYCPSGTFVQQSGAPCAALSDGATCSGCRVQGERASLSTAQWRAAWKHVVTGAGAILAPSDEARHFANRYLDLGGVPVTVLGRPALKAPPSAPSAELKPTLGVVTVGRGTADFKFGLNVARRLRRIAPNLDLVVLGGTIDDIELMGASQVYVTGPIKQGEVPRILRQYHVTALFMAVRRPLFGHPDFDAFCSEGYPVARFFWSTGGIPARPTDLRLNPGLTDTKVAEALSVWTKHL
jgi:GT2 family glycosyltransferase